MTETSERWIYHILPSKDWEAAKQLGIYTPQSLDAEGFIHCSMHDQVLRSANLYFSGQSELLVLTIDSKLVREALRFEDTVGAGQLFPHIYSALNLDAVARVQSLEQDHQGVFVWAAS